MGSIIPKYSVKATKGAPISTIPKMKIINPKKTRSKVSRNLPKEPKAEPRASITCPNTRNGVITTFLMVDSKGDSGAGGTGLIVSLSVESMLSKVISPPFILMRSVMELATGVMIQRMR